MDKINFKVQTRKILADIITPVSIYLKARDIFPNSVLLESSDYRGNENSFSFICMDPIADYILDEGKYEITYENKIIETGKINSPEEFSANFNAFLNSFLCANPEVAPVNGLFGYSSFDAVQYFETIKFRHEKKENYAIPDLRYSFFRYIIAFNHFNNDLHIIENLVDGAETNLDFIEQLVRSRKVSTFSFVSGGDEVSNITDQEYMDLVSNGKKHCYRGDVFQIVLSRQFSQGYKGDDFNVYRALRSVNPSPYLFYFDYGSYRIFGSSPEAQIKIGEGRAIINPIAGTFKRTGDDLKDRESAEALAKDEKENAEHVMLVDLARNDLSRYAEDVTVDKYREVQFYSHVIHLVSTVSGKLHHPENAVDMVMATFPAGTLSGAPKFKAMELIDKYENQNRGYYGGAIGIISFDGSVNHAIMIRTILSKNNRLYYQAGAGIVAKSVEESELQEVSNKLGALKKAIELAQRF